MWRRRMNHEFVALYKETQQLAGWLQRREAYGTLGMLHRLCSHTIRTVHDEIYHSEQCGLTRSRKNWQAQDVHAVQELQQRIEICCIGQPKNAHFMQLCIVLNMLINNQIMRKQFHNDLIFGRHHKESSNGVAGTLFQIAIRMNVFQLLNNYGENWREISH